MSCFYVNKSQFIILSSLIIPILFIFSRLFIMMIASKSPLFDTEK